MEPKRYATAASSRIGKVPGLKIPLSKNIKGGSMRLCRLLAMMWSQLDGRGKSLRRGGDLNSWLRKSLRDPPSGLASKSSA